MKPAELKWTSERPDVGGLYVVATEDWQNLCLVEIEANEQDHLFWRDIADKERQQFSVDEHWAKGTLQYGPLPKPEGK